MFSAFLKFELSFWLRSLMVYIFLLIISFMIFIIAVSDDSAVDAIFGKGYRNSAFIVQRMYGATAVLGCLMVVAFVNAAASRDFTYNTHQLIFTKPISKFSMLMGRFFGATVIAFIPMLGASLGLLAAQLYSPGANYWGPNSWTGHVWGMIVFAIPNTFFLASVVFAIAIWTRSTLASFVGMLALLVALGVSNAALGSLDNEWLTAMTDPFGDGAFEMQTKYWTLVDKNTQVVTLTGALLWNRLLWFGVGCALLAVGYFKFSLTTMERQGIVSRVAGTLRKSFEDSFLASTPPAHIPVVDRRFGMGASVRQLWRQIRADFWMTLKSPIFITIMIGVVITVLISISVRAEQGFGLSTLPVTFSMVETIRVALLEFTIGLVTFYAGVLVWKERDAHLDEVYDACPHPTWIVFVGKLISLMLIIVVVFLVGIACSLLSQLFSGYYRLQVGHYFRELLVLELTRVFCLVVVAMLIQVLSPNKYVGFFGFIVFILANAFVWNLLNIESRLFHYASISSYTYSDMFQYGPYSQAIFWFTAYWFLFACLLGIVAVLFWQRGRESGLGIRMGQMASRWTGLTRAASIVLLAGWVGCAGWIYWNTLHLNTFVSQSKLQDSRVSYETQHKIEEHVPQPRVTKIRYDIDIFPESRGLLMNGVQTIENKNDVPVELIYLIANDNFETNIEIEGATLKVYDEELNHYTFDVVPPMEPGETREMKFTVKYESRGFENTVQVEQIVQNGTFFNNMIAPQIGYQSGFEVSDPDKRKDYGLEESETIAPLDPENLVARASHYISNNSDWVDVETVISTSDDQIAIAPGSLQRKWKENGRRYFHYKLDHPSINFYSFISARYKVALREWNGINIEVYYHPEHEWNVDLMLKSIRKSLEYYTAAFGPYPHKQARIIEFPRVADFAQAFPGTMPYSEGVGFIADLEDEDDIDMVFYIVAHEVAHQWWAHQVVGAKMRGATVLSETLAQYSALMVMEQEYGRDMMRKFLRYEMDNYLSARGRQMTPEYPLKEVGIDQGYVHYNKGSVVMYHLKEMIGEDKMNAALKSIVDRFGYADGPYPTSLDLIEAIKQQAPEKYHGLIEDSFGEITLFANRTTDAKYRKLENDSFEVTIDVEFQKLHADGRGEESVAALDEWIEIGAFAKPKSGGKYGKTLHRERVHVTQEKGTFTFVVDEEPDRVGVDPFALLIDRDPDDNLRKPKIQ